MSLRLIIVDPHYNISWTVGLYMGHPFMTYTRRGKEWSGSGWRMWTGEEGEAPCGHPHRKLKLESTDVILFSSHAKKLASFYQNFVFGLNKKWKFVCDIN